MKENKINSIYHSFLKSEEYQQIFINIKFDLSWLVNKLDNKDLFKLEEIVSAYANINSSTHFECGFRYAWELFHDLLIAKEKGSKSVEEIGKELGEENLARLIRCLTEEKRFDEIALCANDKDYRKARMKEFGIM